MKKKFFSFVIAFVFVLTGAFCLTACGDKETKYFYTIDAPEHIIVQTSTGGAAADAKGNKYVWEGEQFGYSFYTEPGYEIDGSLTLKVNGKATEWTSTENDIYNYTFTPTANFNIKVEGTIIEKTCDVTFSKNYTPEEVGVAGLYMKFAGEAEQVLETFLNNHYASTKTLNYNNNLEFWVYTKGYDKAPSIYGNTNLNESFYIDETKNEFGYHYQTTVVDDLDITVSSCCSPSIQTRFRKNAEGQDNYNYDLDRNNISATVNFAGYLENPTNFAELSITINEDANIPSNILDALTIKVNGILLTLDTPLTNGKNVIALDKPYTYYNGDYSQYAYYYYEYRIDINVYEYPGYFTEIIHTEM